MKKIKALFLLLLALLAGYSAMLRAEDVDIYVDNGANSGVPNVLFVIDNGANFSANAKAGCLAYSGTTTAPALGTTTASGVLQCALVDAINSLPEGAMNIGILVSNGTNFAQTSPSSGGGVHDTCAGNEGGCVLKRLTLMKGTSKSDMVNFIKSWRDSGLSDATKFNIKVNTALPGSMMQEAWAYYNGKVGMSGFNYGTSLLQTGCQRNFVIYIANTEKAPAGESPSPFDPPYGLSSSQVAAPSDMLSKISDTVFFNTPTCGVSQKASGNSSSDWSSNWADEWARLMAQQDRGLALQDGTQNIVTYTIGITNDATCTPDYPALLSSMATYGRGKYFKAANASELLLALGAALNEVQAVNSVFSSASLPVSVNAEGSYLNQIFLGMFRPDSSGNPRWMGNLKQYQLIRGSTGSLVLGDAEGNPAISSAGTGFITPTAKSFWTYQDLSADPDKSYVDASGTTQLGGFFRFDKKGTPASGYDAPDGEVVEKGGVAQQIRKENLKADFSALPGSATNPRSVYVYCPGGANTSCVSDLTDSRNVFATTNGDIPMNAFGESSTLAVSSIVRNGTSAVVTTFGNHGFADGLAVTIANVTQSDYNGTFTISNASGNTFTISGLGDKPRSPTTGTFNVSSASTGSVYDIASITRSTSTSGGRNTETATITTKTAHNFSSTDNVTVNGANPSAYNYSGLTTTSPGTTTLQFSVGVTPIATATAGAYQVNLSPGSNPAIPSTSLSNPSSNVITGNTGAVMHKFHIGQQITVSNASGGSNSKYPGTYKVTAVGTEYTFTATRVSNGSTSNASAETATVSVDVSAVPISTLTRTATDATAVATATGLPSQFFGVNVGDRAVVNISKISGTAPGNEAAYVQSNVTITCTVANCTTFTYPIAVSPSVGATGTMTLALTGATTGVISSVSRTGTTATATLSSAVGTFTTGMVVNITQSGSADPDEAAYAGQWSITCTSGACNSFTFGPVQLTPETPASGVNMQAYSANTPPSRDTVVRWIRGENNQGDEKAPQADITVRPSVHGDVLHSRPVVINYGDTRGIVAFYGANDGIFRAVNGNQTETITQSGRSIPAGGELWGLLLPEHYPYYNRLRLNSPELRFPSTFLPTAERKNYFIDGPTGVFQELNADGSISKAYLYLTMRRGGRFMYAVDVTDPAKPQVLWRRSNLTPGWEELGQTWSRPRLTLLPNVTDPVLIFGGGYDPAQDSEAPLASSMGRAVFVINARTGDLIWRAETSCPGTAITAASATTALPANCLSVPNMTYPIPSEVAFVDRDADGRTDKFYFGDLGGNVWRIDVASGTTSGWKATRIATLGCDTGVCPSGTPPRKFFFPPPVLSIRAAGALGSYEAVSIASGDREHPLLDTTNPQSAYNTKDTFFMIKDLGTTVGAPTGAPSTVDVKLGDLINAKPLNATNTAWDGSGSGFYIPFATGEKAVNAPLAVNGQIFFATNQPIPRSNTCVANLGQARAYAVSPFDAASANNVLQGGGLPPSAVSGLIIVAGRDSQGNPTETLEKFCIGCGIPGTSGTAGGAPPCNTALENCNVGKSIPKNLKRTYWYKK
jgi:type IV pilus assembly protein PilY1